MAMIRDAYGDPIALPLSKLPSVPSSADVYDLCRSLHSTDDHLTAQAMMRKYVDSHHHTVNAADTALTVIESIFPQFNHEAWITRKVYNLPPFELKNRTKGRPRYLGRIHPNCPCTRCDRERGGLFTAAQLRNLADRADPSVATRPAGSSHTQVTLTRLPGYSVSGASTSSSGGSVSSATSDENDPPPAYSA